MSRTTAPCRSRSASNDRAGTHRRLLRLQELGQNLAHAPVRQLIARRQGFLERVADDLRAFARGWGVSVGWPRPRVRAGASERNDSLTGGGGGARRPVPVSPDTAPARTVSSDTSLVSACGSRRDSIVACAGSRSRHLDTRATHSAASSLPWKRCGSDEFAIEASGSGSYGQLDRRRAGPPGRVRSPRFGNRARFQIGTTQHETRGRFFFSARAVTPMPNKIRRKKT